MNHYKKTHLIILIILLSVTFTLSQRRKPTKKGKHPNSSRKVTNPRLKPPVSRKFNHRYKIDIDYDRFEDKTKVQLRLPLNSVESVHFAYYFSGKKLRQAPKQIILLFFKDSTKEFLFPVKDFVVVTDKDRIRIKMVEATELRMNGKTPYLATLDYLTFLRIANAEKADMKIGGYEITFDDGSLEALKELASRSSPNFKEDRETAESKAIEKQVKTEVDKLYRTNSLVKTKIRLILDDMRLAVLTYESSSEPKIKQNSVRKASITFLSNKDFVPDGRFKEMLDSCMKDLVRADILNGINNGLIDKNSFDTSEIIREYDLSKVPVNKRSTVIISNAKETLIQLYTLASMAKIIDIE